MSAYAEWLLKTVAPPWLQGEWGGKMIEAVGEELDAQIARLIQARKAMMPGLAAAETPEAVALIAEERGLEIGDGESTAAHAERLRKAWDTYKRMGSHPALLEQLHIAGFDTGSLHVIQRSGRRAQRTGGGTVVFADGPIWSWSAESPLAYAEFGLLFDSNQPDLTWSTADGYSVLAAKLNRIVNRWRPAKAVFKGTIIIVSGATWGWPPTRTWGSFNWGGVTRFIPPPPQ